MRRLGTLGTLSYLELNTLVLLERLEAAALDFRVVNEQILIATVGSDEAEALFAVEPFHSSLCHLSFFFHSVGCPKASSASLRRDRRDEIYFVPTAELRPAGATTAGLATAVRTTAGLATAALTTAALTTAVLATAVLAATRLPTTTGAALSGGAALRCCGRHDCRRLEGSDLADESLNLR